MSLIKTSSIRFIIINKVGYEKEPAIPLKSTPEGLLVYAFMSRNPERTLLVNREDICGAELTQINLF
jgi:hypothetical protein